MKNITKTVALTLLATSVIAVGATFASTNTGYNTSSGQTIKERFQNFSGLGFERGHGKGGMGGGLGMKNNLTADEQKTLESMTDTEKQAFFEAKRVENESKIEAHEIVIDKLLAGETLTDADKIIVEEIKVQRAEMKAKKAQMQEIRTLIEKQRNGETLTADEQTKLDELKSSMPQKGAGKGFGRK